MWYVDTILLPPKELQFWHSLFETLSEWLISSGTNVWQHFAGVCIMFQCYWLRHMLMICSLLCNIFVAECGVHVLLIYDIEYITNESVICYTVWQEFACNGTVVEHPEYGEVIQLQGDQRQNISKFIKQVGLAREDQIKVCSWPLWLTKLLICGLRK